MLAKNEKFMLDFIKEVCEKIGPRPACSEEERRCASLLEERLKEFSDFTKIDRFYCHPGAYKASFRWPILIYVASIPFYYFIPVVSVILTSFALLILFGETAQNREIIDFIFEKKESTNVIAKIKPKKEVKGIIILSGHHDSNVEFPLGRKYGSKINIFMSSPIFFNILLLIASITRTAIQLSQLITFITICFFIATIPYFLFLYKYIISDIPVIGANDNLSALAVCLAVAKHFSHDKNRLKNSELWIVSFGCEEIGIRGSKRFVSKYLNEIKDAYHINLDLVGEKGCRLFIDTKEEMGTIKLLPEVYNIIENAAKKIGKTVEKKGILSFTDSMSFVKKGIKSAGIVALQPNGDMPRFYHTTNDIFDIIDPNLLRDCLKICIQTIQDIDENISKRF